MPQANYPVGNPAAVPGMLKDNDGIIVETWAAAVAIPFGLGVEMDATGTKVQLPLGAGTTSPLFRGISLWDDMDEPGGYQIGDAVRVLRRGRIAVTVDGATTVAATDTGLAAGLDHSSTLAADRGKFSKTALNGVAGTEISDVNVKWAGVAGANMAWVEINTP